MLRVIFGSALGVVIGMVLGAVLLVALVMGLLISGLAVTDMPEVSLGKENVLVVDFDFVVNEGAANERTLVQEVIAGQSMRNNSYAFYRILEGLSAVKADKRIKAVVLDSKRQGGLENLSLAQVKELRDVLSEVKGAGVPVYGFASDFSAKSYYLTSLAEFIGLEPLGGLKWSGLGVEVPYWGGLLSKLGIGVQKVQMGSLKFGGNELINERMSDVEAERLEKILKRMWELVVEETAVARGRSVNELNEVADQQGYMVSIEALAKGWVNGVMEYREFKEVVKQQLGLSEKVKWVGFNDYMYFRSEKPSRDKAKLGFVAIEGMIAGGADDFVEDLKALGKENVDALVVRVDSPGGDPFTSEDYRKALVKFQGEKPVVVSYGSAAASGGYWVSCYADKIVANPLTLTGSIGVYSLRFNVGELAKAWSVGVRELNTHQLGSLEKWARPLEERELTVVKKQDAFLYGAFLKRVREGRGIEESELMDLAEGRVFMGAQAVQNGLVDELGGVREAFKAAAKLVGKEDYVIEDPSVGGGYWNRLFSRKLRAGQVALVKVLLPRSWTCEGAQVLYCGGGIN